MFRNVYSNAVICHDVRCVSASADSSILQALQGFITTQHEWQTTGVLPESQYRCIHALRNMWYRHGGCWKLRAATWERPGSCWRKGHRWTPGMYPSGKLGVCWSSALATSTEPVLCFKRSVLLGWDSSTHDKL